MLLLLIDLLWAHDPVSREKTEYTIMTGYQYRTNSTRESLSHPHCSVLQYNVLFPFRSGPTLGAFVDTGINVVGLNQSLIQPNIQATVGFSFGSVFRFGTGPTIALHASQDPPFFPQLLVEGTFLINVDKTIIPIRFSYVPRSQDLEQYQVLIGYNFVFP